MDNNGRKKIIYLDACLDDIEAAQFNEQLEKIYNNQELFGFFAFHDEHYPYSYRYIEKAEYCRNHGFTLQQMLEELQYLHNEITAKREIAALLLEELHQYDEEEFDKGNLVLKNKEDKPQEPVQNEVAKAPEIKEQPQQKKQPYIEDREIKSSTVITVAISLLAFILFIGYFTYSSNYAAAEQELIEQKYSHAMAEYKKAYEAEQNKTESDICVSVKNTLISNNSVGNEWYIENYANNEFIYSVDGLILLDGEKLNTIHLKFGNPITVETYIAEDDKWPDSAKNKYKHTFSKTDLINGCYITQTTYVQENNGRYKGNTAKWETRYDFQAVMNYPEEPKRENITVTKKEVRERMRNNVL